MTVAYNPSSVGKPCPLQTGASIHWAHVDLRMNLPKAALDTLLTGPSVASQPDEEML